MLLVVYLPQENTNTGVRIIHAPRALIPAQQHRYYICTVVITLLHRMCLTGVKVVDFVSSSVYDRPNNDALARRGLDSSATRPFNGQGRGHCRGVYHIFNRTIHGRP